MAFVVQGTKLTGRTLAKLMKKFLDARKKHKQQKQIPKTYRGKQSVKQLVRQNAGVSNIEISDGNIKSFEKYARKYGVDFALKKDTSVQPPKWLVFFKARDADALTSAFSEFSAKTLGRNAEKPSVLALLRKTVELVKNQVRNVTKDKSRGGPEL